MVTAALFGNLDRDPVLLGILRDAPDALQLSDDLVEVLPVRIERELIELRPVGRHQLFEGDPLGAGSAGAAPSTTLLATPATAGAVTRL